MLVLLMVFLVFLGRAGGAIEQVRHAADVGARAASMAARPNMDAVAAQVAGADLAANGVNCASTSVGLTFTTTATGTDSVTVTVTCTVNTAGTSLLGTAATTVTARSTEVIDQFRGGP